MRSINFNIFVSTFLVYFCFFLEILLELCDLLNLGRYCPINDRVQSVPPIIIGQS